MNSNFSTALHALFMDIPAHTLKATLMNTDVSNNLSADQEFYHHQKLLAYSFKCRLKNQNQNSATRAKPKKQSQNDNEMHKKVEVNSDTGPFDKVLQFKINRCTLKKLRLSPLLLTIRC